MLGAFLELGSCESAMGWVGVGCAFRVDTSMILENNPWSISLTVFAAVDDVKASVFFKFESRT